MTIAEELKEIAAGLMRRVDITADSLPTPQTRQFDVWAFHANLSKSRGTADMIEAALQAGVMVRRFVK